MTTRLSVVVPVHNEEHRLRGTLDGLSDALARLRRRTEIVVVDNDSTDGSAKIALSYRDSAVPVRLLSCVTHGKGAAVRTGVLATSSEYTGFCDADLATDVRAFPPMLAQLDAGVNVVIGSRAHRDSKITADHGIGRRTGASVFRFAVRRLVPGIGDTQCGFKFFDRATAEVVFRPLCTHGFAFDAEVLARAQRAGALIAEIPVTWTDAPGSTFNPVRDGYNSFASLARIRAVLANEATAHAQRTPSTPGVLDSTAPELARGALRSA
ncbi:glycosyltransferase [Haloechinothrix halophila]|uniref:glycosyltransferase n=1 Tax=Haloechinothrix halophila TaxID=1069073 RepID=UPI00040ACA0C|nr:glycosyltransferase [Haloechinothrix halophila]